MSLKEIPTREYIDPLVIPLTPDQRKHMESIMWLVSPGPVRTGRTHVLAVAFLMVAFRTRGQWVQVWDHVRRRDCNERLLQEIAMTFNKVFEQTGYKLSVSRHDLKIKIEYLEAKNEPTLE